MKTVNNDETLNISIIDMIYLTLSLLVSALVIFNDWLAVISFLINRVA